LAVSLPSLRRADLPRFPGWKLMLGPGIVWAALAQGTGELIFWPAFTAKYGEWFLWLIIPASLMQFGASIEIGRYTVLTGETIFTGLTRLRPFAAALLWAGTLAATLWFGAFASAGGTALGTLTQFPSGWDDRARSILWAEVTVVVFFVVLIGSRYVYGVIERFMMAVAAVSLLGVAVAAAHPRVIAEGGNYWRAVVTPHAGYPPNWDPADLESFLTSLVYVGMGGFYSFMYAYWLREKGAGMAGRMGRVAGLRGRAGRIEPAGFLFDDTEENRRSLRHWLRYLRTDNALGLLINLVTVLLMCWLAFALLRPEGLVPKDWELAVVQSRFFEVSWGAVGKTLFLFVAAAFLADTWVGVTDGFARMHADWTCSNFDWARRTGLRRVYLGWVTIIAVGSVVTIPLERPEPLLAAGGTINFLSMAVCIPILFLLNHVHLARRLPAWTRPSKAWFVYLGLTWAFYLSVSLWYLRVRLGG
jgi:Mn2+/Fe2+ NRAMP family transporter